MLFIYLFFFFVSVNQTALTLFGSLIQRHFGLGSSGQIINLVLPSNNNKVLLRNINRLSHLLI